MGRAVEAVPAKLCATSERQPEAGTAWPQCVANRPQACSNGYKRLGDKSSALISGCFSPGMEIAENSGV